MRLNLLLFLFFINLISCKYHDNSAIIKGEIKNFAFKKVYLTDSYKWEVILDSADVINGIFEFKRKKVDFGLYSIYYKDFENNLHSIEYINRILSPDSLKYLTNYFMLDSTFIKITGDWKVHNNHYYEIFSGEESQALFRTQMMQFGILSSDLQKRTAQLNEYISIIKKYPNSNYLLSQINQNKSVLKKTELEIILNLFSKQVLNKTALGNSLTNYLSKINDKKSFENYSLEDHFRKQKKLFINTSKLNMLIFWASWCSPCRAEIPFLKKINKLYSIRDVSMTSVSIDDDIELWHSAVNKENMNWRQLIVPHSKKEEFIENFEISSIPLVIFLDNKGNLISRTIGVDSNSFKEYINIIENYLK